MCTQRREKGGKKKEKWEERADGVYPQTSRFRRQYDVLYIRKYRAAPLLPRASARAAAEQFRRA